MGNKDVPLKLIIMNENEEQIVGVPMWGRIGLNGEFIPIKPISKVTQEELKQAALEQARHSLEIKNYKKAKKKRDA